MVTGNMENCIKRKQRRSLKPDASFQNRSPELTRGYKNIRGVKKKFSGATFVAPEIALNFNLIT